MSWSFYLLPIAVVAIPLVAVLLDRCLKYVWRNERTRRHKTVRKWLIRVSIFAVLAVTVGAVIDRYRSERQRQRLERALKEAEADRNGRATVGRLGSQPTRTGSDFYCFGGTTFFVSHGGSVLNILRGTRLNKIAEQNSLSAKNVDGKLVVSARLQSPDGLVAEITENEWKINPQRIWDRNYSTNALEIKNPNGEIVFQILLVRGELHFQGMFFDSTGYGVAFTGDADSSEGGSVWALIPGSAKPRPAITALFKYPSELHLGVREIGR